MNFPNLQEAEIIIREAAVKNPGPWVAHSYNVAKAASILAGKCKNLDTSFAYICGLLHDIGRREGVGMI